MHYLVSLAPEKGADDTVGETYAGNGEPVVPWFPAPVRNMFLSVDSWDFAPYAIVVEGDFDIDAFANRLCEHYPGLPAVMHSNYVLATAMAAAQLPVGTRVRPIITPDTAHLQVVNEDTVLTLWEKQPIKGPL